MSKSSGDKNSSHARKFIQENKKSYTEQAKSLELFEKYRSDIKSIPKQSFKPTVASLYSKDIYSANFESGKDTFYTSSLHEGYANVEEVSGNIKKTNVPDENEAEEIFIATPLESNYFSDQFSSNNQDFNFVLPHISPYTESDLVDTVNSLDQSDSDSDEEITFKLYSDSSSDDDYSPGISSFDVEPVEDRGNLPNFNKLDPADNDRGVFKTPINPLISKRTPTATVAYSSEANVDEPTHISKFDYPVKDTETIIKKKQSALVTTDGRKPATFCSTNIQSALLNKITPENKESQSTIFNDFTNMQIPRRTAPVYLPSKNPSSNSGHDRHIEVDLENFETEVGKAFEESVNEGSLMPLLKQELQCKIQVRRLSMGQSELVLEPEEPRVYELTDEEIQKRHARLEQNRRSAKKSRHKARKHEQILLKHIKSEMTKHASLTKEVSKLTSLRDEYKKIVELHMMLCTASMTGNQ